MKRLFPHPYLSVLLFLTWLLLVNSFSWGSVVFALLLSIVIPALTAPYWPDRPLMKGGAKFIVYVGLVLFDIVVANIEVTRIVLFKPVRKLRPAWVTVPLDLTSPEAITVLSGTITLTPGTVTCDISEDGRALLVHCLHAPDPDSIVADIKSRYEARLKEIFP